MKITIPFRLFGDYEGKIELNFNPHIRMDGEREEIEEKARRDAKALSTYLGAFKDEFQRRMFGYERVPGIGILFWEVDKFRDDEVLNDRLVELLREDHAERMGYEEDVDSAEEGLDRTADRDGWRD